MNSGRTRVRAERSSRCDARVQMPAGPGAARNGRAPVGRHVPPDIAGIGRPIELRTVIVPDNIIPHDVLPMNFNAEEGEVGASR